MKKKILLIVLAGALLSVGFASKATAATTLYPMGSANHVNVYVNDQMLQVDQNALIKDGRTLVPLRAIFEALGATIQWDEATQTVTANRNDTGMKLAINSNHAKVNDQDVAMDVPAAVVNDRTMVPVRFVSEALGAKVAWDQRTNSVFVIQRSTDNIKNIGTFVLGILDYIHDFADNSSKTDTIYDEYLSQKLSFDQFKSQYDDTLAQMKKDIDSMKATTVPDDQMAQTFAQKYVNLLQEGYDILSEREQVVQKGSLDINEAKTYVNDVLTFEAAGVISNFFMIMMALGKRIDHLWVD